MGATLAATLAAALGSGGIAYGAGAAAGEHPAPDASPSASASSAAAFAIHIGEREATCTPRPRVREGHVLVPISFFTDCLGGSVSYDDASRTWTLSLGGRSLLIRSWQRHFVLDGRRGEAPWAPELLSDALFIPLWTISHSFGLDATVAETPEGGVITCRQLPGGLRGIRCGTDARRTRVVLDVDLLVPFSCEQEADGSVVVHLPPPPPGQAVRRRLEHVGSRWVQDVRQRSLSDGSIEVRIAAMAEVTPKVFTLGNPARIVVDVGDAQDAVATGGVIGQITEIPEPGQLGAPSRAGGVWLQERRFGTATGPARLNVLYADLCHPDVRVQPALAAETIRHRAYPSAMARREGAYAAANGGFYAPRGEPLGMLMVNREWISHPIYGRAVLGIMEDGRAMIRNVDFNGSVLIAGLGTLRLTGINARHERAPELIAYNGRWGDKVGRASGTAHVAITDTGVVSHVETAPGETPIPPGGWVLSGTGATAPELARAQPGTRADLSLATNPPWDGLVHALGAGPRLVSDGRPHVTARQERFRGDVRLGSAARTAVGVDADGRLLIVAIDGRGASGRRGMTLDELASTLAKLGARDAMNLDGGSSSTLAVQSRVVNRPAGGWERAVSNALLVFAEPQPPTAAVASGQ
ncbi:MAG: phosphodiester glycosidase family protein [Armatimonadota bacterium]